MYLLCHFCNLLVNVCILQVAIVLGIILVTTIQPGTGVSGNTSKKAKEVYTTTADTLMDLVRNLIPPNVFQATMQQTVTALTKPDNASLPGFRH